MTVRARVAVGAALVVMAGAGAVWLWRRDGRETAGEGTAGATRPAGTERAPAGAGPPTLRFAPRDGETIAYDASVDSRVEVDVAAFLPAAVGGGAQSAAGTMSAFALAGGGQLNLKYYAAGAGRWNVAATITAPTYAINGSVPAYAGNLGYPFAFQMDALGRLSDVRFARGTRDEIEAFVKTLLLAMQVVLPERPAATWTTEEDDATGEYTAAYDLEGVKSPDGERDVSKKKLRYLTTRAAATGLNELVSQVQTDVEASASEFVLPARGAWVISVRADDRFAQRSLRRVLARSATQIHVTRLAGAGTVEFPATFEEFAKELRSGRYILANLYATDPTLDQLGAGLDMAGAVARYRDLRSGSGENARKQAEKFMVNYLRQHPEAAAQLIAILNADGNYEQVDKDTQLVLLRLIAEAGHPQAQQALLDAAQNPEYSGTTRIRAMAYMGDFVYPDGALVQGLWKQYEGTGDVDRNKTDGTVKSMSLLALGALGYRDKLNDDIKPVVGAKLREALDGASNPWDQQMALRGIGNYGSPDALDAVEPYFQNPDAEVRAAAYWSLRRMDDPSVQPTVIQHYEKEQSAEVKVAALQSLAQMPPGLETVRWVRQQSLAATDPAVQVALVNVLGKTREAYPANDDTMRQLLAANPPRDVTRAIYNYIPPK